MEINYLFVTEKGIEKLFAFSMDKELATYKVGEEVDVHLNERETDFYIIRKIKKSTSFNVGNNQRVKIDYVMLCERMGTISPAKKHSII